MVFALGDLDGSLQLFKNSTFEEVKKYDYVQPVNVLEFSPSNLLAINTVLTLDILDIEKESILVKHQAYRTPYYISYSQLYFSDPYSLFALCYPQKKFFVYDIRTGGHIPLRSGHFMRNSVRHSVLNPCNSNQIIASNFNNELVVYDIRNNLSTVILKLRIDELDNHIRRISRSASDKSQLFCALRSGEVMTLNLNDYSLCKIGNALQMCGFGTGTDSATKTDDIFGSNLSMIEALNPLGNCLIAGLSLFHQSAERHSICLLDTGARRESLKPTDSAAFNAPVTFIESLSPSTVLATFFGEKPAFFSLNVTQCKMKAIHEFSEPKSTISFTKTAAG